MKNTLSLNLNTLFRRLYYKGKTVHSPYFTLYYQKANKGPVEPAWLYGQHKAWQGGRKKQNPPPAVRELQKI